MMRQTENLKGPYPEGGHSCRLSDFEGNAGIPPKSDSTDFEDLGVQKIEIWAFIATV